MTPLDPGGDFVPAAPVTAQPTPVLAQTATSRGSGEVIPATEHIESGEMQSAAAVGRRGRR